MTIFLPVNDVSTTLAASASSTATVLTLSSIANLPASIPSGMVIPFTITTAVTAANREIVYATAISGANITVIRAQENTSAQNWNAGDSIFVAVTAGLLQSFANLAGNSSQTFSVAAAATETEAVPLAQAFQLVQPTSSQTIALSALNTLVMPAITAAVTITMAPGASTGQKCRVTGGRYAVTVASNVSSGYPWFAFPDDSFGYDWTIPAGYYGAFIDLIWDGVNWRASTGGQTVIADAASGNQALALGQLQNNTLALSPTTVDASGTVSAAGFDIALSFGLYNNSGNYTIGLGASQYIYGPSGGNGALTYNATGHYFNSDITVNGGAGNVYGYGIFSSANNAGLQLQPGYTGSVNYADKTFIPHNAANGTSGYEVVNYSQFAEPISATALASGNDNTVSATASFSAPGPGLLIASGSRNNSSSTGIANSVTLYINGNNVGTENSSSSATIFGTATTSGGTVSAEITAALSIPFSARVSLTWIPFGLIT